MGQEVLAAALPASSGSLFCLVQHCRTTEQKSNSKLPEGFGNESSCISVEIGSIGERPLG